MKPQETALQIAEACGMKVSDTGDDLGITIEDDCGCCHILNFNPLEHAEDAVLAAEKYGLMYQNCQITALTLEGGIAAWGVWHDPPRTEEPTFGSIIIGSGTFCEAICQAILYLESKKPVEAKS